MTTSDVLVGASENDWKKLDLPIGEMVRVRGAIEQLQNQPDEFMESVVNQDFSTSLTGQGKGSCSFEG